MSVFTKSLRPTGCQAVGNPVLCKRQAIGHPKRASFQVLLVHLMQAAHHGHPLANVCRDDFDTVAMSHFFRMEHYRLLPHEYGQQGLVDLC
jgi:hypothetical protein